VKSLSLFVLFVVFVCGSKILSTCVNHFYQNKVKNRSLTWTLGEYFRLRTKELNELKTTLVELNSIKFGGSLFIG